MAVVFTMSPADIENSKRIAAIVKSVAGMGMSMVVAAQQKNSKEIVVENEAVPEAKTKTPEAQNPVAPK